jgi:hypothetical protein
MMLTAMALFQDAETPMGRVGYLSEDREGLNEATERMARAFRILERIEVERGQDQRDALYLSMRKLAEEHDKDG